ncbi:hypothetical protein D3C80_2228670 [compost metagenome]
MTIRFGVAPHSAYRSSSRPSVLPRSLSRVLKSNSRAPKLRFSSGETLKASCWMALLLLNGPA